MATVVLYAHGAMARERERESGEAQLAAEGKAGAPGGRPGCVHPGACALRGCRALQARHGGTARPSVAWTWVRARGGGDTLLVPPFPFSIFFEFLFSQKLKCNF